MTESDKLMQADQKVQDAQSVLDDASKARMRLIEKVTVAQNNVRQETSHAVALVDVGSKPALEASALLLSAASGRLKSLASEL